MRIKHTEDSLRLSSMQRFTRAADQLHRHVRTDRLKTTLVAAAIVFLLCVSIAAARLLF